MRPTLLVFAAGMGSRYGGLKQLDQMGPSGETIIDYSIYDAVRAGFGKIVYIVREYFREEMQSAVLSKYDGLTSPDGEKVEFHFVSQELDMIPKGFIVPEGREKPWGTGHAILVAKDVINEPFVTINGDDYYGRETFQIAAEWCHKHKDTKDCFAVLGFILDNTLTEAGGVNRGICHYDSEHQLQSMVQHLKISKDSQGIARGINAITGEEAIVNSDALCSMNMFCLTPDYFDRTEEVFRTFLSSDGQKAGKEFDPPFVFDCIIKNKLGSCQVLSTPSHWFGVTYREDRAAVVEKFRHLTEEGIYPSPLWK